MKKVAILGTADSVVETPWDEMEVWVCGEPVARGNKKIKKYDRLFELHDKLPDEYLEKLADADKPVFLPKLTKLVPKGLKFPRAEMREFFGYEYYSCTIAWMLAYAIYTKQYDEIFLFGVELAQDEEYVNQRKSVEHWIGQARGRGIAVYLPPQSEIMTIQYQYGFDGIAPELAELLKREKIAKDGLARARAERENLIERIGYLRGGIEMLSEINGDDERIGKYKNMLAKQQEELSDVLGMEQNLSGRAEAFRAMKNMLQRRGYA